MIKNWTIDSIVSKIIEIEGKGGDKKEAIVKDLKERFETTVSVVPIKKIKDTMLVTDINKLLENDEVQTKISVFFEKYEKRPDYPNQKGGGGECCYLLFLCFLLSIWFTNMATLQEQCNNGAPEDPACRILQDNIDSNIYTFIINSGGGRKRKRTKKKKRRKKRKGTKKRR